MNSRVAYIDVFPVEKHVGGNSDDAINAATPKTISFKTRRTTHAFFEHC